MDGARENTPTAIWNRTQALDHRERSARVPEDGTDVTLELLSTSSHFVDGRTTDHFDLEHGKAGPSHDGSVDHSPAHAKRLPRWLPFRDQKEVVFLTLVALNIIPIVLLIAYAPELGRKLGQSACLPNGNFVVPGNVTVWDSSLFFTISITARDPNKMTSGWSYTSVKVMDIFWDVVIGRGGQILLVCIAYRVFSRVLTNTVQDQAVSFRMYGDVALRTGSLGSTWALLVGVFDSDFPGTGRTRRNFTLMILASLYISSMPTLFSAMTGYAAIGLPSIESNPPNEQIDWTCGGTDDPCVTTPCIDPERVQGLYPAAIFITDAWRLANYISRDVIAVSLSRSLSLPWYVPEGQNGGWQYYEYYKGNYDAAALDPACANLTDLRYCPALNKTSSIFWVTGGDDDDANQHPILEAPMPDIHVLGHDPSSPNLPEAWSCSGIGIYNRYFTNYNNAQGNVTGLCTSTGDYEWGFSFQILLIVCICNCIFAAIMYGLWIEARRSSGLSRRGEKAAMQADGVGCHDESVGSAITLERRMNPPSILAHVMVMANQAEQAYGSEVKEWSARELRKRVWHGKKGMSAQRS